MSDDAGGLVPREGFRIETDSIGEVEVPSDRLWGAQTQRAAENFPIGSPRYIWGRPVIAALGTVKRCAAEANRDLGVLSPELADAIVEAADEVAAGHHDDQFPLVVWQSGSGTQTNMNANEVIANRAIALLGGTVGSKHPVHPNDHVNMSQSTNDVFPTAMHLAVRGHLADHLVPAVQRLRATLASIAARHDCVVKAGRTHLQDAAPVTLGQEIAGWVGQLDAAATQLARAEEDLEALAIGGTAVGTGLNAPDGFAEAAVDRIARRTGRSWRTAAEPMAASSAHDALLSASAAVRATAAALIKIGNDVRWLASGPRTGIGELVLPANEPGSSIMPGKVNPTQVEALTMVAVHVHGNDAAVAFAATQGSFQLNAYKPLLLHEVLDAVELLAEAIDSFDRRCASGIEPDLDRIEANLGRDLMLVTALAPHIGYDRAAAIAHHALESDLTLRQAALADGLTAEQFDDWVVPADMV